MKRVLTLLALVMAFSTTILADDIVPIRIITSQGDIRVDLNRTKAPKTVENMLSYIKEGFYKDTAFHRVIKGFMIQGGGFTKDLKHKSTHPPIRNEADNGLKNVRGSIAMARTSDPHSATSQFFINHVDNHFLDYTSSTFQGWGYAVFGKVTSGMDVVDKITNLPTGSGGPFGRDVPKPLVIIKDIVVEH
ncbi:MAG: peptidyl-prolyl cis-trans isomerase [Gammaproteobacteria bacterium]|nr:MAG: peptidyl-prolyl cis-trans isomerase [Gammaproteobacteria bacterium]